MRKLQTMIVLVVLFVGGLITSGAFSDAYASRPPFQRGSRVKAFSKTSWLFSQGWSNLSTLHLDGVNDYAYVPSDGELSPTTTMSACTWFYQESSSTTPQVLMSKWDSVNGDYSWIMDFDPVNTGLRFIACHDAATCSPSTTCSANAGLFSAPGWHHACATFDAAGQDCALYLDGAEVMYQPVSGSWPAAIASSSANITIGNRQDGDNTRDLGPANVDNVCLSTSAIWTDSEVYALWNNGQGAACPSSAQLDLRMGDGTAADPGYAVKFDGVSNTGTGSRMSTAANGCSGNATCSLFIRFRLHRANMSSTLASLWSASTSSYVTGTFSGNTYAWVTEITSGFAWWTQSDTASIYSAWDPSPTIAPGDVWSLLWVYNAGSLTLYAQRDNGTVQTIPESDFAAETNNANRGCFGSEGCSDPLPATLRTNTEGLYWGGDTYSSSQDADMDFFLGAVWHSALDSTDAAALFPSFDCGALPTGVATPNNCYEFGNGASDTGTTIVDQGSEGANGTLEDGGAGTIARIVSLVHDQSGNDNHAGIVGGVFETSSPAPPSRPAVGAPSVADAGSIAFGCAGQSNASGRGSAAASALTNGSRIDVYNNADTLVAISATHIDDTTGQTDSVSQDSSVGVTFCRSAADRMATLYPSKRIIIIPMAMGGSASWEHMPAGDIASPSPNYGTTRLYGNALRRMTAVEALSDTELVGVFVYQGEADTGADREATKHAQRWRYYATRMREQLNKPALPFIFVQLGSTVGIGIDATRWSTVRAQQASLPGLDQDFRVVEAPACTGANCESDGSGVHLSTPAQEILGPNVANAWAETRYAQALTP